MNDHDQDRLLRDILTDEELERIRADSLQRGLATLRRRQLRRTFLLGAAGSLAVAVFFATLLQRQPPLKRTAVPNQPSFEVKIINDAQLLALFPNRPTALVGSPGEQKLIFLDGK